MMKIFAGLGCFGQILLLVLVTWLNILAIGYVLLVFGGQDAQMQWSQTGLWIRILVAFVLSGFPIPLAAVAFLLSLVVTTPIF